MSVAIMRHHVYARLYFSRHWGENRDDTLALFFAIFPGAGSGGRPHVLFAVTHGGSLQNRQSIIRAVRS